MDAEEGKKIHINLHSMELREWSDKTVVLNMNVDWTFLGPSSLWHDDNAGKTLVRYLYHPQHYIFLKSSRTGSWSLIRKNINFYARCMNFILQARNEEKKKRKDFGLLYFLLFLFLQRDAIICPYGSPQWTDKYWSRIYSIAYQEHRPRTKSLWFMFYGAKEASQTQGRV